MPSNSSLNLDRRVKVVIRPRTLLLTSQSLRAVAWKISLLYGWKVMLLPASAPAIRLLIVLNAATPTGAMLPMYCILHVSTTKDTCTHFNAIYEIRKSVAPMTSAWSLTPTVTLINEKALTLAADLFLIILLTMSSYTADNARTRRRVFASIAAQTAVTSLIQPTTSANGFHQM